MAEGGDKEKQPAKYENFRYDIWIFGTALVAASVLLFVSALLQNMWLVSTSGVLIYAITAIILLLYLYKAHRDKEEYLLFRYDRWVVIPLILILCGMLLAGRILDIEPLHSAAENIFDGFIVIALIVIVYQWRKDKKAAAIKEAETPESEA